MYVSPINQQESMPEIVQFLKKNGFALLISQHENRPWATHIPLHVTEKPDGSWTLMGHVSKANPSWKSFAENEELLAVFSGAHDFISASWYEHTNVSTWNYLAVHIYCKIRFVEGAELVEALTKLTAHYEGGRPNAVTVDKMPEDFLKKEMRGLVGFELLPTKIEGSWKLSQNRNDKDYVRIIEELEKMSSSDSREVASEMRGLRGL
jgi:transcriptional regulator